PWNRLRFFIPVQKSGHRLPYMEQQRPSQHFIHFNLNALRMQGKRKNAAFHDGGPNRRPHRSAPSPGSPPPPHPGLRGTHRENTWTDTACTTSYVRLLLRSSPSALHSCRTERCIPHKFSVETRIPQSSPPQTDCSFFPAEPFQRMFPAPEDVSSGSFLFLLCPDRNFHPAIPPFFPAEHHAPPVCYPDPSLYHCWLLHENGRHLPRSPAGSFVPPGEARS